MHCDSIISAKKEGIISLPGEKNQNFQYSNPETFFFLGYLAIQRLGGSLLAPSFYHFFPSSTEDAYQ